jgi:hypothetical protein
MNMIESLTTSILGLGLPSLDLIKQASLDIISKLNLEGWFASLEPYHLGMITMALLTISLIFMVVNRNIIFMVNRQQDIDILLNPNSDIRMFLSENRDKYPISRKILWQILQNHFAHLNGNQQYSLNTFPADAAGYISTSTYLWIGQDALPHYRNINPGIAGTGRFYMAYHKFTWQLYDGAREGGSRDESRWAHAHPIILNAVIARETLD